MWTLVRLVYTVGLKYYFTAFVTQSFIELLTFRIENVTAES